MSTDSPGASEVLTIEEAAALLRIGRSSAYALARQWRASGGRQGLPNIELGRQLRVPGAALRRLLETGSGLTGGEEEAAAG
jgi:transposase